MRTLASALVVITLAAGTATAQPRAGNAPDIPPGHRPPPGLCRIWIDGVPPGRQPAPTRCEEAVLRRPANARVIYGDSRRADDGRRDGRWDDRNDRQHERDDDDRWERRDDDGGRHRQAGRSRKAGKGKDKHRATKARSRDLCYDRKRDGWCDGRRGSTARHEPRSADTCYDRNRDGRCDDAVTRRATAEELLTAILSKR